MKFKLLVMVKNLCARNIIQNAVQGISKAPDLFLNKHKITRCFPKFQVYKHNARKMRLSKFIVDWEISCLRADDHLVSLPQRCCPCVLLWITFGTLCHLFNAYLCPNSLQLRHKNRRFVCLPFVRTGFASFFCFFLALSYLTHQKQLG